jgi:hypothetical protein
MAYGIDSHCRTIRHHGLTVNCKPKKGSKCHILKEQEQSMRTPVQMQRERAFPARAVLTKTYSLDVYRLFVLRLARFVRKQEYYYYCCCCYYR